MTCAHLGEIEHNAAPTSPGCYECTQIGSSWVHLRRCITCGHVGCCDSSPNRHAAKHFHSTTHPLVQSYEPGEDWIWCFVDEIAFEIPELIPGPSHP